MYVSKGGLLMTILSPFSFKSFTLQGMAKLTCSWHLQATKADD
jgi:hypothetical protein